MKLHELLIGIEYQTGLSDIDVHTVTADSRQITPGAVFVCVKGQKFDGHTYGEKAVAQGAVAVVCEKDLGLPCQIIVPNSRLAYGLMCSNLFGNPSQKLKLIGITGTNGKTTITYILKHILEVAGKKTGLIGTIHNEIADITLPAKHTTPDPMQLHSILDRMAKAGCEYTVMEVSSHALDQHRLAGCHFQCGVFTNLTQDHLDYHLTMENYYEAKKKLFSMSDKGIINLDDAYGRRLVKEVSCAVSTFSVSDDQADYTAKAVEQKADGSRFTMVGDQKIGRVMFQTPGGYSVSNAMAAAVAAMAVGIPFDTVIEALNTCKGVCGRAEVIAKTEKFTVIRDYAHTPDGLEKMISTLKEFAPGRVVTLFGCAGNRDRTKRSTMAQMVSKYSDFAILTSDNPRDEDPMQILEDAKPGLAEGTTPFEIIADRYDAIKWALENLRQDDILLLAGKGHEDYQVLDFGTIYFDEKVIVQELLGL